MIRINIEDREGGKNCLEIPGDISLSLMEVLVASEYPILATCGGMALCATCHVEVTAGSEMLGEPSGEELDMLDTLPDAGPGSRLSCQIRISEAIDGLSVRIKGDSPA